MIQFNFQFQEFVINLKLIGGQSLNLFTLQWNLIITVTLGPSVADCYIEVAFLQSGIQNHNN